MSATYCHTHDVDEPSLPGDYIACLECGHVYRTSWQLRREYLRGAIDTARNAKGMEPWWIRLLLVGEGLLALVLPTRHIAFCPLCMHDFAPRGMNR